MNDGRFIHHDDDEAKLRSILKAQRTHAKVLVFSPDWNDLPLWRLGRGENQNDDFLISPSAGFSRPTAMTTWIVWPQQRQRPDAYFPHSQNLPLVDSLNTTPTEPHIDTHRNVKPPVLFGFWGKILLAFLGFTSVLQGILEVKLAWFVLSSCAF